jgi:L-ascorbate metabolism protein UlaG (beta-lactamase superfamily)
MHIIYYGHSTFEIQQNKHKILFDPFISPNPKAGSIQISYIKPTLIAISHAHGDHIADAESIAKTSGAPILANYEITSWFANKGVEATIGMNTGGTYRLEDLSISLTQAIHSSSFPDGSYGGNPNGFAVTIGNKSFYYAGDTDLFGDMHLIGTFYTPDFAFLPIGDHFTMGIERAAEAAKLLNVKKVIGMHFDTFPPIAIDHTRSIAYFKERGIELILPEIGQTITLE